MTLIAAFWCAGDQAVLVADSQETCGEYKTAVSKVQPVAIGRYQLAYCGSGFADLVDAFGEEIERSLETCRADNQRGLQDHLQQSLTRFYKLPHITVLPFDPQDSNSVVSGIICIRIPDVEKVFLFRFGRASVLPVTNYTLKGFESPLYENILQRLYRDGILPLQARLLGLHLMSLASNTSAVVGEPFQTVFAMTHGMFGSDHDTDRYLEILDDVQAAMDGVLLSCADVHAVDQSEFNTLVRAFVAKVRSGHDPNRWTG